MPNERDPAGENVEASELSSQPETKNDALALRESSEIVPHLQLTVAGPCNTPDTDHVGLSKAQREKLHVNVGDNVELLDASGKSLGRPFRVGLGSKELIKIPQSFTANGVAGGTTVTVRKASEKLAEVFQYDVVHAVENAPNDLSEEERIKYELNHERRKGIIESRLKMDPDVYIVVPQALAQGTSIAKGKVRFGGDIKEIAVIPSGNKIGFTTKAAQELGIPSELKNIRVRIADGVLVIA